MSKDGYQLTDAAARSYEELSVPAIFAPLARATLALHEVKPDDVVLDIACGSGIVVRMIRELFGEEPTVTGIDLNEGMIATARDVCSSEGVVADFRVCDATSTPFEDGEFTFVICQQGLQFFPDEDAALAEFRRVGAKGARFAFSVWSRPSPLFFALADALRIHASAELAQQCLAPFSWSGSETIGGRMTAAGYAEINIDELEVNRVLDNPAHSVPKTIMSTPVGPKVAAMGDAVFDTIVNETLAATTHYRQGEQLVIPQHTHLISAVAG